MEPPAASFSALQRAENSSIEQTATFRDAEDGFSALQRAENSSIRRIQKTARTEREVSVLFSEPKIPQCISAAMLEATILAFQCSSASRKFLNEPVPIDLAAPGEFQCSSASRKFLNEPRLGEIEASLGFSALQRAENSSIAEYQEPGGFRVRFSALQRAENSSTKSNDRNRSSDIVSVLFSEPKIPQP